ncbi:NADH-cytochrome b5 reductase-like [Plutella xylostella]|uniref:NADH-cytochrome b5 reductase-like n=1 Tax=Plutella xylostella TaxID=51655 RepID=UPI00203316FF|nr:NADH-cytochrome b5 reductase-like [Plutella xylostella]XP_011551321.3 NADH-cytochrome b5 reductase-like [Plutella xylostella]XP_037978431.2 NADH-cytochrome b5 reductase-like [Plutella xylostella]XP_048485001.1 NADH-cytochrome b5 reductase-like [Plutella xylostella]
MKPPVEPKAEDCCNSGCNPCIFDVYEKQLQLYHKSLRGEGEKLLEGENGISQLNYTTFVVTEKIIICDSHVLIKFKNLESHKKVTWSAGDHFLIKYYGETKSCTKAYTPIHFDKDKDSDFIILLKRYSNGLVSNFLYALEIGTPTLWRGPYGSFKLFPNKYKRMFMIAQGTGIATFIKIIEDVLKDEDNLTKIILLFCCKNISCILLREYLYSCNSYWNFDYQIFLSTYSDSACYKYKEPIVNHKLSAADFETFVPFTSSDQFLACGSAEFMNHFKDLLSDKNIPSENICLF